MLNVFRVPGTYSIAPAITNRDIELHPTAGLLPPEEVIFGFSKAMSLVRQIAAKVAPTNITVLIEGENGTGKELIARWMHSRSPRSSGLFIKVNCAALPGPLLESELFGYEKGAFMGAVAEKPGRVEMAHRGSLFLDEIGEIDHCLQAKLLHFLQDRRFSRIGDHEEKLVETCVVCSTNRHLEDEVRKGRFRADLFYRINGLRIQLPRLRDRREDVPILAEHFLRHFQTRFGKQPPPLSAQLIDKLQDWDWPGNIRELENRVARYVILGADEPPEATPNARRSSKTAAVGPNAVGSIPLKQIAKEAVRETERRLILEVLQTNRWNRRKTAEVLQISYRALIYKIRDANLASRRGESRNCKKSRREPS